MVIRNVRIITNDPQNYLIEGGTIAFRNGLITYVGQGRDLRTESNEEVIDGTGKFILPSLVNAHLSLHSTVTSPMLLAAEDSTLGTVYYENVVRLLAHRSDARISLLSTIAGVLRSLRYGITTIFGPVFFSQDLDVVFYRELARDIGIQLSVGPIVTPKNLEEVLQCWKDVERDELFCPQIYITDSAQYSNTQLSQLGQLLNKGFSLMFVVFDMNEERDECLSIWGETLTERLTRAGLLRCGAGVAYAGSLSDTDMDLLSSRNVFVSKSVRSELYGGIYSPMIADLLGRGMQVNIGSGFVDVDLFAELKTLVLLERQFNHFDNKMIEYEIRKTLLEGNFKLANQAFSKNTGIMKEGYSADMMLGRPFIEIDTFDPDLPGLMQLVMGFPTEVTIEKVWNNGRLVIENDRPAGLSLPQVKSLVEKVSR